jgi:hypothetical protein
MDALKPIDLSHHTLEVLNSVSLWNLSEGVPNYSEVG